jgi:predicted ATPase
VHRLEGELLVQINVKARGDAERKFRYAIDLAQSRREISLELRAAMSLTRLLEADRNRLVEGRAVLADIYQRFTEGFETGDLRGAKALLERFT